VSIIRKSPAEKAFGVFNTVFMGVLCVVCLYPMWHVVMASLSDPMLMFAKRGLLLWPIKPLNLLGYSLVMSNKYMVSSFVNTIIYVVAGTALNMFVTLMGAYGLSRKGLYWNGAIMKIIAFTMYFQGGLIPFYLMVKNMRLLNTYAGIILPVLVSTWNLIVMRTSFSGVHESLEESARLDGANDWTILWRIFVPLGQASIAVISLYYAVYWWNNWFNPSIFLSDRGKYPLQLLLREILIKNSQSLNEMTPSSMVGQEQQSQYRLLVKYCVIVVATAPILAVYPFLQKYFVKGVMIGSIKG
jgi:putative aldouronate transport system permease protein